jgi:hypothetical protein
MSLGAMKFPHRESQLFLRRHSRAPIVVIGMYFAARWLQGTIGKWLCHFATGCEITGREVQTEGAGSKRTLCELNCSARIAETGNNQELSLIGTFARRSYPVARGCVLTYVSLRHVIGTIYLLHELTRRVIQRGSGRILITGSIAGLCWAVTRPLA